MLNSDAVLDYNICSVGIGVLYFICEKSHKNTYENKKSVMQQSNGLNGDLKPEHKKNQSPLWKGIYSKWKEFAHRNAYTFK